MSEMQLVSLQSFTEMGRLFPDGVVVEEFRQPALRTPTLPPEQVLLTPEEWACIMHCHERRVRDFAAGRLCAHRALERFGITGISLLPGSNREPVWPQGFTGSITHTQGYSAAVVGRIRDVGGLGIDTECIDEVQPALWQDICAPAEFLELLRCAPRQRRWVAALTFVAKEAFYKCQFPMTRERLDFDAVSVHIEDVPSFADRLSILEHGRFLIRPLRPIHLQSVSPASQAVRGDAKLGWEGHFRLHDGFASAGIALPAMPH